MTVSFADLELNYRPFLPATREAEILDVGCGHGRVLAYLKGLGYTSALGVERDPRLVELVRNEVGARAEHVADLREFLAARKGCFDLIVAKDVIYYFPRAEAASYLSALGAALKPGGRIILEVFNGVAFTGPYVAYKDHYIEWIPTEISVASLLEDSGFTLEHKFAQIPPRGGLRRGVFNFAQGLWQAILRLIYLVERGVSEQNPTIFSPRFLMVARRK